MVHMPLCKSILEECLCKEQRICFKVKGGGGKMEEGNLLLGIISNEKTTSSTKSHIALIWGIAVQQAKLLKNN